MESVANFMKRLLGSRKMIIAVPALIAMIYQMFNPSSGAEALVWADRITLLILIVTGTIMGEDSLKAFAASRKSVGELLEEVADFARDDTPSETSIPKFSSTTTTRG